MFEHIFLPACWYIMIYSICTPFCWASLQKCTVGMYRVECLMTRDSLALCALCASVFKSWQVTNCGKQELLNYPTRALFLIDCFLWILRSVPDLMLDVKDDSKCCINLGLKHFVCSIMPFMILFKVWEVTWNCSKFDKSLRLNLKPASSHLRIRKPYFYPHSYKIMSSL